MTAEIRSYYGPTAWDSHAGHLWHYDCPDTVGAGHDGQVTEDDDGVFCGGCRAYQPPAVEESGADVGPLLYSGPDTVALTAAVLRGDL